MSRKFTLFALLVALACALLIGLGVHQNAKNAEGQGPVEGAGDQHLGIVQIVDQLIDCVHGTGPPGHRHRGTHFEAELAAISFLQLN